MNSVYLFNCAEELIAQCGTRDPAVIAKETGIDVNYSDRFTKLLGLYTNYNGQAIVMINDNLDAPMKRIVTAHEVGHNELHRHLVEEDGFMEFNFLSATNQVENEANVFAAHLLLNNDEVFGLLRQGYDIGTVSKMMSTNINLLIIKIKEMNKLGYKIPFTNEHDSNFFNKISDSLCS